MRLTEGDHRFLVRHFWKGDFHFDRVALLRKGRAAPQAVGPAQVAVSPDRGTVETRDVTPPAVAGLVRVRAPSDEGEAAVGYEVSSDRGKTWRGAAGGDLARIAVRGDGRDTLRFRLTLHRPQDVGGPTISGVELAVRPKRSQWLAVRNNFIRVLFDGATGRLFRLTDLERGREVLWSDEPIPIFSAELKKRGESWWRRYTDEQTYRIEIGPRDKRGRLTEVEKAEGLGVGTTDVVAGAGAKPAAFVGGQAREDVIRLDYRVEQNVRIRFSITLDDTGQSTWTAEVQNDHADLDLIRLQFPRFAAIRLGTNGMDDHQLLFRTFGHHRRRPCFGTLRGGKYPGPVALPWESVYDEHGGLGIIVRDPRGTNVGFESATEGAFQDAFSLSLRKYDNVRCGGGQAAWEYAVAVHPGQWHWVADRYREWAVQRLARPRYPNWFADSNGYYFYALMNTGMAFEDLGKLAKQARRLGLKHVQIWGQFTGFRYGCCGPYWQPSPRYGTIDQFQQGIADIHAAGCKVGFYFLHDRIDLYHAEGSHIYGFIPKAEYPPDTEFPTRELFDKGQLVTDPAGKARPYPLVEADWDEYEKKLQAHRKNSVNNKPPTKWHAVDLSDPSWWSYMAHWAIDKYVEEWGADGHYYDVLGCGKTRESFDLRKGHHGHGLAGIGRAGIARTTVESAQQRGHRDYFLLQEGLCDVPGQWTAGASTSLYYNQTAILRYTWPDYIMFDDQCGQGARNCMRVVEMGFLNGNRLGIRVSNHVMAQFVETRARIREWLTHGRFMDTLGLESPVPARLFLRREPGVRGAVVTFLNRDGQKGTAELDAKRVGNVRRAIGIDKTGGTSVVPISRQGDAFSFPISTAHVSAVVLAEDVDVAHGLIGGLCLIRDQEDCAVRVTVANLSEKEAAGRIAVRSFGPLTPTRTDPTFTCRSGEIASLDIPVNAKEGAGRFARLSVDLEVAGRPVARIEHSSFPRFEDPSFEELDNDEREACLGQRSLRMDPTPGFSCRRFPLHLKPAWRYRLSLAYKRTPGESKGS
ncbi:hypothetical protein H8D79_00450, partial [PVC group bacterium]|nr:hypothetical protein [PVC group bacterium]